MSNPRSQPAGPHVPGPRAFAQGVGLLLQSAGFAMFIFNCCLCSVAGVWDPLPSRGQTVEMYQQEKAPDRSLRNLFHDRGRAGVMLTVMFTTVGGLALASFGLGLQSDRRRAAQGALVTAALLCVVLILSGVALWTGTIGWGWRILHALLLLATVVLTGFCVAALRQVLAHPPPRELEIVKADEIERL